EAELYFPRVAFGSKAFVWVSYHSPYAQLHRGIRVLGSSGRCSREVPMLRGFMLALSCLVVPTISQSQADAPKEAKKQSIQGKVIEARSGQPVRKVKVEVIGGPEASAGRHTATTTAGEHRFGLLRVDTGAVTTNDLGEYRIADLRPGKYLISVTPPQRGSAPPAGEKGNAKERLVYAPTYYPGTVDKSQAIEVEM